LGLLVNEASGVSGVRAVAATELITALTTPISSNRQRSRFFMFSWPLEYRNVAGQTPLIDGRRGEAGGRFQQYHSPLDGR
jgi:hypothetical protein